MLFNCTLAPLQSDSQGSRIYAECVVCLASSQVLCTAAHELVLAALPAVEELRSTTARMALLLFQVSTKRGFVLTWSLIVCLSVECRCCKQTTIHAI